MTDREMQHEFAEWFDQNDVFACGDDFRAFAWRVWQHQQAKIDALRAEVERLRENEPLCPRPCNGQPDDLPMAQCIVAGECGCTVAGSAFARRDPLRNGDA
jgi:hypothetical protein